MAVIQTMGLSKRYKDRWAVDHLDLLVEQGDTRRALARLDRKDGRDEK